MNMGASYSRGFRGVRGRRIGGISLPNVDSLLSCIHTIAFGFLGRRNAGPTTARWAFLRLCGGFEMSVLSKSARTRAICAAAVGAAMTTVISPVEATTGVWAQGTTASWSTTGAGVWTNGTAD